MFWNNVKIALRNLRKHKGFAAINITGLAIGLTIYVFGGLLVDYERTHDVFFGKYDRIYTWIGSDSPPTDRADLIDDGELAGNSGPPMVAMNGASSMRSTDSWKPPR